jgi:acetyl/propionyl-CoA carboxylase alpha subunit
LQVEHPVTEAITGLDLVEWQIRIANGEKLEPRLTKGDRSAIKGHAIEARVISEDPAKNFMPSVGKIVGWAEPLDPTVRIDTGYAAGSEVSRFYDSLLAKVIVSADTRASAIASLKGALKDFHVLGVTTNIPYVLDVVSHPDFEKGEFDTGFLSREFGEWKMDDAVPDELAILLGSFVQSNGEASGKKRETSPAWSLADAFRITS